MMSLLTEQLKTRNINLKRAEIEGLLFLIKNRPVLDGTSLIRETGLPKETVNSFLKSIKNILEDRKDDSISFSEEGLKQTENEYLKPYNWSLFSPEYPDLEQKLADIRKEYNLQPQRKYDQFFATVNSSIKKYHILKSKGLIEGKNIMLLGDDDLVSVVLALSGGNYSRVNVLDVDKKILSTIENIFAQKGFKGLRTGFYDVRNSLKEEYFGRYDVVLTDPPYTAGGIKLFLNRAVQMLKQDKTFEGKYVLLNYGNSFKSPEKTIKIQEIINSFGLVIEDKINNYIQYYGAESIGANSSLYVLKSTPGTRYFEEWELNEHIYTYEKHEEQKFPYVDHLVIKILDVPEEIISSKNNILEAAGKFCDIHKLKVIDTKETHFSGQGMTVTFVLANSNLVLHTWPENNAVHIDLITCRPIHNKERITKTVIDLFKSKNIIVTKIE